MEIEKIHKDEYFIKIEGIDDIKDYYLISNYGRIYSTYRHKIINPYVDQDGYFRIELAVTNSKRGRKYYVHRLVAFMFVPGYFEGAMVNHINSDRQCNQPDNLEWVTALENSQHAKNYGYLLTNNTSEYRKLNHAHDIETVKHVCELIVEGLNNNDILDKYEFNTKRDRKNFNTFINDIRAKRSFVWLSDKYFNKE